MEVLNLLLKGGLIYGVCYIANIIGKCYVATISRSTSDNKAKSFSKMMSKDININLHQ
nr:MAG TPA: hypothetical protein [Caudoviricetes sp.]